MKNIIKYLLLTVLFILPIGVNALSFSCEDGSYGYKESFKCNLRGPSNLSYNSIKGEVDESDYFTCKVSGHHDAISGAFKDNVFNYYGTMGDEGEINLIEFECTVKVKTEKDEQQQVVLKNVTTQIAEGPVSEGEVLRSNFVTVKEYINTNTTTTTSDSKPRDTSNGNSLLKKLSDPELDKYFTFSKFVTKYPFEVPFEVDKINLKYETNVEDAKVRIVGSQTLQVGENIIDIYVTSPDNLNETCYTLTITRLAAGEKIYYPDKDATLKKLEIKNHPINFESVIKEYKVKIDALESELQINADTTVKGASFIIEGNKELKHLSVITITVKSKDNTQEEKYSIQVIKEKQKEDYSSYIYLGIVVLILVVVIVFIVISSNKRNSEMEKSMSKLTKVFKKKKTEEPQIPNVTAGGTTAVPQVQPVQPVQPVPQVQPVQPIQPVQPVPQVQPVQPVAVPQQPVQPVAQPTVPQQPVQPVQQPVQDNTNNQV